MTTRLSTAQVDRAAGVLLGMACGDALGAGYEFGPPLGPDVAVTMGGGGHFGWAPGEWTDDTSMAIAIAEVTATGADLRADEARDRTAARWAGWAAGAKDVGNQTRDVLSVATRAARSRGEAEPTGDDLTVASVEHHERTGRSGGNGSLMRTAPIALAYLHDPDALVLVAHEISAMTHHDHEAGQACALWCLAIRHAVLRGGLDVRSGLAHLPEERAKIWADRLDAAEAGQPAAFDRNGWVVQALQGAWSAITTTAADHDASSEGASLLAGPAHLRLALEAAVRGGRDTDKGVDAVVSLCRMGDAQVPAKGVAIGDHIEVWLIDESEPDKNPNLDFVLTDVAEAIKVLRAEGRTVLLHCVQAQSRTPAVAGLYGARLSGRTPIDALADVRTVLPYANPNRGLRAALERLG